MLEYDRNLKNYSRNLRSNLTDSENKLWSRMRRNQICGVQFYRQKPIGSNIVDFYAPKAELVVELDGSQHLAAGQTIKDGIRDEYLKLQGLFVLRFNSREVLLELEAVVQKIFHTVEARL
ncbi:MAG: DUF559 domain-containing protein [Candidatus Glassbacteria bacterium]